MRPIAPPGSGSNMRPTMTPAKIAKYNQACCGRPWGGGMTARMIATATGAMAFQEIFMRAPSQFTARTSPAQIAVAASASP